MALLNSIVNGELTLKISIQDRGFNYGDGLFETIAMLNRQPLFWVEHYQRLLKGCNVLGIHCPTEQKLKYDIEKLAQLSPNVSAAVVKIIVTRGNSERGYQYDDNLVPNVVVSLSTYPSYPSRYWSEGIKIKACETRLSTQKRLAGLKHLNRLEQIVARQEWKNEYQEGLMADVAGNIIEGVMSNIFVIKDNVVHTPVIINAGVNGIMRNIILKLCEANGIMVTVDEISFEQVLDADEVFLTNSIMGVWPVKKINNQFYTPGLLTKNIMNFLTKEYSVDYATLSV